MSENSKPYPYPFRTIKSWTKREHALSLEQSSWLETQKSYFKKATAVATEVKNRALSGQKIFLDIGCGDGQSLLQLAQFDREAYVLGVEPHTPGAYQSLFTAFEKKLENCAFFHGDILDFLAEDLDSVIFDRVHIYFSDPWQKKRHHKRRLIQKEFLLKLTKHLKMDSLVHIATDWAPYAEHIQEVLKELEPIGLKYYTEAPTTIPIFVREPTKYERKAQKNNRSIFEFYIKYQPVN